MQIRYCESCGVKLTETNATGSMGPDYCTLCTNALSPLPDVPIVSPKPLSRKSSATRLPAIVPTQSAPLNTRPTGEKAPANMSFYFCETCGKRVTEGDVAAGRARNKQVRGVYCVSCAEGVMTMTFDAITQEEMSKAEALRRQGKQTPSQSSRLIALKPSHAASVTTEASPHRPRTRAENSKVPILALSIGCILVALILIGFANYNKANSPVTEQDERKLESVRTTSTPQIIRSNPQPAASLVASRPATPADQAGGRSEKPVLPEVTDVRADTARFQLEQAQRGFAVAPTALDAYGEKLSFIAKNYSDTPSGIEAKTILGMLAPSAQTETATRVAIQSPPTSETTTPTQAVKMPHVVDTQRAAYAVWLKSFHVLWANRNWNAAKVSVTKALKNPALESKSASLKVAEESIALVELAEKATAQGAIALKDGRAFTLESVKKKDRFELGRKTRVTKVDETAIIIEQTLGAGKIEFSLPFTDLTPETKFSLARIGLTDDGVGKVALAFHRFADLIKQEKGAGDVILMELLEQARTAHAPSEQIALLDHWLIFIEHEKKSAEALANVRQTIVSTKLKEAREALEKYVADYSDTAFFVEKTEDIADLKKRIEALNIQPGVLASYYSGTIEDRRKKFHLTTLLTVLEQDNGRRSPAPGVPIDQYEMELNGILRINEPGNYTFVLIGDDALDMWLDGKNIGSAQWDRQVRTNATLASGDHAFKAIHCNNVSDSRFKIKWIRPGKQSEETIPLNVLFHTPQ